MSDKVELELEADEKSRSNFGEIEVDPNEDMLELSVIARESEEDLLPETFLGGSSCSDLLSELPDCT